MVWEEETEACVVSRGRGAGTDGVLTGGVAGVVLGPLPGLGDGATGFSSLSTLRGAGVAAGGAGGAAIGAAIGIAGGAAIGVGVAATTLRSIFLGSGVAATDAVFTAALGTGGVTTLAVVAGCGEADWIGAFTAGALATNVVLVGGTGAGSLVTATGFIGA